jgi:hypothetical protein
MPSKVSERIIFHVLILCFLLLLVVFVVQMSRAWAQIHALEQRIQRRTLKHNKHDDDDDDDSDDSNDGIMNMRSNTRGLGGRKISKGERLSAKKAHTCSFQNYVNMFMLFYNILRITRRVSWSVEPCVLKAFPNQRFVVERRRPAKTSANNSSR